MLCFEKFELKTRFSVTVPYHYSVLLLCVSASHYCSVLLLWDTVPCYCSGLRYHVIVAFLFRSIVPF